MSLTLKMSTLYGFYSPTQERTGWMMFTISAGHQVMVTEVQNFTSPELSLFFFQEEYQLAFPDGFYLGRITPVKRDRINTRPWRK